MTYVPGPDAVRRKMQVVMAGPLAVADAIAWPPAADARTRDERNAAVVVDHLDLDHVEWWLIEEATRRLILEHRSVLKDVGDRLLEVGAIPGSEVQAIVTESSG